MDLEHRAVLEVRATGRTLHGIAAPFNRTAEIGGRFRETIMPGAFVKSLGSNSDILALADHRSDALLGRTRSGTLRLAETTAGLEYSLDLPATSLGNDLLVLAQRGDLGGISIGFTADSEAWPDKNTRQLLSVALHEVSVIRAHAAYDTTIAVRARQASCAAIAARRRLLAVL